MLITEITENRVNDKKIRVCAYCRVSSKHEEQLTSIENQISHYKDVIGNNEHYEFVGIYYDRVSGNKDKRPQFQKMMADAREKKFDIICTKSISRFARNTYTMISAVRELKELGIGVYFELQNMNTLNMEGEMLLTIYAAFAQAESDSVGDLLRMSHKRRALEGNHNVCFISILGYSSDGFGNPVPDKNAWIVEKMFVLASEGYNPSEIARSLNAEGIRSYRDRDFSGPVVRKILRNPTYKGVIVRRHYCLNDEGDVIENDGTHPPLVIKGYHKPIVSEDLWEKAQASLEYKKLPVSKESVKAELESIKGRVFCACCGYAMHGTYDKRSNTGYLRCYGSSQYGIRFCSRPSVPLSALDKREFPAGRFYIATQGDSLGRLHHTLIPEEEWKGVRRDPPALAHDSDTEKYEGLLYCGYCNRPLSRYRVRARSPIWTCRWGRKHECRGIRIKDDEIKRLNPAPMAHFFKEMIIDGKKYHSYTREDGCAGEIQPI